MKRKSILLSVCLSILFAGNTPDIVQTAFDKMAADSVHSYSYTKRIQSTDFVKVISFDASKEGDDQWELISVNNQPPTKAELKDFYKEFSNTSEKDKKSMSFTSDDMFDLQKKLETSDVVIYQCKMNNGNNKKMMEKVLCNISINKSDSTLNTFKMELTEPVSPIISVKLDEFSMEMVFQKMAGTGANLVKQTNTKIKGKAMVFKELDQQVTEKYYDYKLIE